MATKVVFNHGHEVDNDAGAVLPAPASDPTTAADVTVDPLIAGKANVQEALEGLAAVFANLPSEDPGVAGLPWNNLGVVMVSAG